MRKFSKKRKIVGKFKMNYPTSSFPCFEIKKECKFQNIFCHSLLYFYKKYIYPGKLRTITFFIREKYFEDMTAISQLCVLTKCWQHCYIFFILTSYCISLTVWKWIEHTYKIISKISTKNVDRTCLVTQIHTLQYTQ